MPRHILWELFLRSGFFLALGLIFLLNPQLVSKTNHNVNTIFNPLNATLWWFAPFFSGGGYSTEAISLVLPLKDSIHVVINQHGDSHSSSFLNGLETSTRSNLMSLYRNRQIKGNKNIVVCHSEPGAWDPPLYQTSYCPPPIKNLTYVIGRTMFETDRIPPGWVARCNNMDEIWVPTDFHVETFKKSGVDAGKLVVIPEPVDTNFFNPLSVRRLNLTYYLEAQTGKIDKKLMFLDEDEDSEEKEGGREEPFRFLSIFKWEKRKGWDTLLRAFFEEFRDEDANKVELLLLTSAYHSEWDFDTRIERFVGDLFGNDSIGAEWLPSVRLIENHLPTTLLPSLYKSVDSFVLPSRGEGWGRPHIEAMSMGLPVIATNWSGNVQFMNSKNSYLIEVERLEEIKEPGLLKGHFWAVPSVKSLRTLMRRVVENPRERKMIGRKARASILRQYSQPALRDVVMKRIHHILNQVSNKETALS